MGNWGATRLQTALVKGNVWNLQRARKAPRREFYNPNMRRSRGDVFGLFYEQIELD